MRAAYLKKRYEETLHINFQRSLKVYGEAMGMDEEAAAAATFLGDEEGAIKLLIQTSTFESVETSVQTFARLVDKFNYQEDGKLLSTAGKPTTKAMALTSPSLTPVNLTIAAINIFKNTCNFSSLVNQKSSGYTSNGERYFHQVLYDLSCGIAKSSDNIYSEKLLLGKVSPSSSHFVLQVSQFRNSTRQCILVLSPIPYTTHITTARNELDASKSRCRIR